MPLYQHLLSIQENAGGPRNTEYAAVLTKYAFVLRNLKRKPDAVGLSAQARAAPSADSAGFAVCELTLKPRQALAGGDTSAERSQV